MRLNDYIAFMNITNVINVTCGNLIDVRFDSSKLRKTSRLIAQKTNPMMDLLYIL